MKNYYINKLGVYILVSKEEFDAHKYLIKSDKRFGLGDLIHSVANPIAKGIDGIAGTKIQGCGGCAKRREALNKLVPSIGINPSDKP